MQVIEADLTDCDPCFTAMLEHWLAERSADIPCPTWSALTTALRSPVVDRPDLAEKINKKHMHVNQHI